jgi:hypothetical protein
LHGCAQLFSQIGLNACEKLSAVADAISQFPISRLLGKWLVGLQGAVVPGPFSRSTARINDL